MVRELLRRLDMVLLENRLDALVRLRTPLPPAKIAAPNLGIDWDPARRAMLLSFLITFIAIWIAVATDDLLLAPSDQRFRVIPMNVELALIGAAADCRIPAARCSTNPGFSPESYAP
jgi:hypothetical protein